MIMSTTKVRFLFSFQSKSRNFERCFDIPSALIVTADDDAHPSDEYRRLWSNTKTSIMEESEAECVEHAPRTCACGAPTSTTSQIPMPFLSLPEPERFVLVVVHPLCGREKCRTQLRQKVLPAICNLRFSDRGLPDEYGLYSFTKSMSCKVCATVDDVKRCSRCQTVAYCGKAHQRQDWARHKSGCIPAPGIKESRAASTPSSGPQRPRPAGIQETLSGEVSDDEGSVTYEWTTSGVFTTDEGIQYEVTHEEVLAFLLSGGDDDGEYVD